MLVHHGAISSLCKLYGCSEFPQENKGVAGVKGSHGKGSSNINIIGGRIRASCFTRTASVCSSSSSNNGARISFVSTAAAAAAAAIIMFWGVVGTNAFVLPSQQPETLSDIPQMLSGDCSSDAAQLELDCKKARIQRPKSRKAESCTIKCVSTCIRGGFGSPGEGPLNVRRPLVVFKQGFRSRRYCLVECSDICNLIGDGDDGP